MLSQEASRRVGTSSGVRLTEYRSRYGTGRQRQPQPFADCIKG